MRIETEDGSLHCLPPLVVEDHREERQAMRLLDEVTGHGLAEEVGAIADGGDHGSVWTGQLHPERGPEAEAEAARMRRREVGPGRVNDAWRRSSGYSFTTT